MTDLLSQNEVDALLEGVDEGAVDVDSAADNLAGISGSFDLSCNSNRLKGWYKQLSLLDGRLGKSLGQSLLGLLHKTTVVDMEGVRVLRFGEYVDGLEAPTGMYTYQLEPAGGVLMLALDAHLVYSLIESFFGGKGRGLAISNRGFTRTEQRVLQLGLNNIVESIKSAWKQLENQQLSLSESEHNPLASTAFPAADVVMVRRYSVKFDGGGGELHLVMCSALVETLFEQGGRQREAVVGSGEALLRRRATDFKAVVAGEVTGAQLSLKQLLNLRCGDVIPVDSPEIVDVKVNGVKKFSARVGEIDGRVGLSILHSDEATRK